MKATIEAINQMQADGIIGKYAGEAEGHSPAAWIEHEMADF